MSSGIDGGGSLGAMNAADFEKVLGDVPDEQRRLLEEMLGLGLVSQFMWNDASGQWRIDYTAEGREFLRLVKAASATEPRLRLARLIALYGIAEGGICLGGFQGD